MTDMPGGSSAPSARYGRAPMPAATRRRIVRASTAGAVLLGLAAAVVAYQRFEGTAVKGESGAYEILDDHTVSLTVDVTRKDPATPVVCIVRARARDGSETGRREFLVPPSTDRTVQVTTTVKSYKRSFAGDVYGCGTTVPRYLTAP